MVAPPPPTPRPAPIPRLGDALAPCDPAEVLDWPLLVDLAAASAIPMLTFVEHFRAGVLIAAASRVVDVQAWGLISEVGCKVIGPSIWTAINAEAELYFLTVFGEATTALEEENENRVDHVRLFGIRVDPESWRALTGEGEPAPRQAHETSSPGAGEEAMGCEQETADFAEESPTDEQISRAIVAARQHFKKLDEDAFFNMVEMAFEGRALDRARYKRMYAETRSQRRDRRRKADKLAGRLGDL